MIALPIAWPLGGEVALRTAQLSLGCAFGPPRCRRSPFQHSFYLRCVYAAPLSGKSDIINLTLLGPAPHSRQVRVTIHDAIDITVQPSAVALSVCSPRADVGVLYIFCIDHVLVVVVGFDESERAATRESRLVRCLLRDYVRCTYLKMV